DLAADVEHRTGHCMDMDEVEVADVGVEIAEEDALGAPASAHQRALVAQVDLAAQGEILLATDALGVLTGIGFIAAAEADGHVGIGGFEGAPDTVVAGL